MPEPAATQQVLDEVRFNEQVYFKGKFAGFVHYFYFPDARTVVCSFDEERVRERIKRGSGEQPAFLRGDDWRQVDRGLFAVAIDTREDRWKLDVSEEAPSDLSIAPLLTQASRWVAGVDASDVVKVHAIATCPGEPQGATVARIAQASMAMAKVALAGRIQALSPKKADDNEARIEWEMKRRSVERKRICWRLVGFVSKGGGRIQRRAEDGTRCARSLSYRARSVIGSRAAGRLFRMGRPARLLRVLTAAGALLENLRSSRPCS